MENIGKLTNCLFNRKGKNMENRDITIVSREKIFEGYINHMKDDDRVSVSGVVVSPTEVKDLRMSYYIEDIVKYDRIDLPTYVRKFKKKLKKHQENGSLFLGIFEIAEESNIVPELRPQAELFVKNLENLLNE